MGCGTGPIAPSEVVRVDDVAAGQLLGQGELRRPRRARRAAARTAQPRRRPADPRARLLRRQRRPGPAGLRRADDRRRVDRHLRRGDAPGRRRARRAGPGAAGARGQGGAGAAQRHLVHERVRVHRGGSGPRTGRPGRPADGDVIRGAARKPRPLQRVPVRRRQAASGDGAERGQHPPPAGRLAAGARQRGAVLRRHGRQGLPPAGPPGAGQVLDPVRPARDRRPARRARLGRAVGRRPRSTRQTTTRCSTSADSAWRAAATSTAGTSGRRWTR